MGYLHINLFCNFFSKKQTNFVLLNSAYHSILQSRFSVFSLEPASLPAALRKRKKEIKKIRFKMSSWREEQKRGTKEAKACASARA